MHGQVGVVDAAAAGAFESAAARRNSMPSPCRSTSVHAPALDLRRRCSFIPSTSHYCHPQPILIIHPVLRLVLGNGSGETLIGVHGHDDFALLDYQKFFGFSTKLSHLVFDNTLA